MQQAAQILSTEGFVSVSLNGRSVPWVAERWSTSADGLTWNFILRPGLRLQDGQPLTATMVAEILRQQLPASMGSTFEDVTAIQALSDRELSIQLARRSNFLLEALNVPVAQGPSGPATGAFATAPAEEAGTIELRANPHYDSEPPLIDRIVLRPYPSIRSAWAEMLRGNLDVLYEAGMTGLDGMPVSTTTKLFTAPRPYEYVIILNLNQPHLKQRSVRQGLNAAIDREEFVREGLMGHGRPATGVVWPDHWANSHTRLLSYEPRVIADEATPLRLTLLLSDRSHERLGLLVQRQLRNVGVEVVLEFVSVDEAMARVGRGDFDAWLADLLQGPTLLRSYWFWHSKGPYNRTHYRNRDVDTALERVRRAVDDDEYKAGVAAFERALVDDPPAIFLAWGERARAVSTRFAVPAEPGLDPLRSVRSWRPLATVPDATEN